MIDFATDDLEELCHRLKLKIDECMVPIDILIAICIIAAEFDLSYDDSYKLLHILEDVGLIQIYNTKVRILV